LEATGCDSDMAQSQVRTPEGKEASLLIIGHQANSDANPPLSSANVIPNIIKCETNHPDGTINTHITNSFNEGVMVVPQAGSRSGGRLMIRTVPN